MAVDQGVPICGIVAMTGTEEVPANFKLLDGSTINEPRSPIHGESLPNWHSDSQEYVPTQVSPYNGTTYSSSNYNFRLSSTYMPDVDVAYNITKRLQSDNGGYNTSGTTTTTFTSGNSSTFNYSILYSNYSWGWDSSQGMGGSGRRFFNASGSRYTGNSNHYHSGTVTHEDDHVIAATSGSYPVKAYPSSTGSNYSLSTNGYTTPSSVPFTRKRNCMQVKWYMRIY